MATIKELREQAANVVTEARSMLDSIADDATAEVRKEAEIAVDKALDEACQLEGRAERLEKREAAEKRSTAEAERQEGEQRRNKRTGYEPKKAAQGEMSYRAAFPEWLLSHGEDGHCASGARAVLEEKRAQTTANTAGGY